MEVTQKNHRHHAAAYACSVFCSMAFATYDASSLKTRKHFSKKSHNAEHSETYSTVTALSLSFSLSLSLFLSKQNGCAAVRAKEQKVQTPHLNVILRKSLLTPRHCRSANQNEYQDQIRVSSKVLRQHEVRASSPHCHVRDSDPRTKSIVGALQDHRRRFESGSAMFIFSSRQNHR